MNSDQSKQLDVSRFDVVSEVIRSRRTSKVLALNGQPIEHPHDDRTRLDDVVLEAIADAGYAPFHYDRNVDGIAEPWRFYLLKQDHCRHLGRHFADWFADMKPGNKLPSMLSACGCLVLIYWLPQFAEAAKDEKQIQIDEEHLAATAAATQNLLLSLTAAELKTYWSSGGFFRTDEMKNRLGIALNQKLLSAIFVDYGAAAGEVEIISGKQHAARSDFRKWTKELSMGSQSD